MPSCFEISALGILGWRRASTRRSPLDQTMNAFIGRFTLEAFDGPQLGRRRRDRTAAVVDRSFVVLSSLSADELIASDAESETKRADN